MKKIFLSVFVIVTFAAYAVNQHLTSSDQTAVLPPQPTDTPTQTQTTFPSAAPPQPTNQQPTPQPTTTPVARGQYRDGSYTGNSADAYYGNIQVKAIISGGKITDVQFLDYPQDRGTSVRINTAAMPYLKQEAIQAQNANVDIVSGATDSSRAFIESLTNALSQAK
jgi:uncharacterized protein with FMN-binding domain